MRVQKPRWKLICNFLAHVGFVCAHCCHDPGLAILYAVLLCGDLLDLLTKRSGG
jgi:hypothetical protein